MSRGVTLGSAQKRLRLNSLLRTALAAALCAWCAAAGAQPAPSQAPPGPGLRPSEERPALPPFRERAPGPFLLPPVPAPAGPSQLAGAARVFVKRVEISGNTVVPTAELAEIAKAYEGRIVTSEDLHELRNKLSLAYINRGYINSGAVLPDQDLKDGVVRYQIIEGRLLQIEITGNDRLRPDYLRERITLGAGPPLNVNELQQRLQILQQDGLIERINAELVPGTQPGEAVLKAEVHEAVPYQVGLAVSNRRPPSVGAYLGEIFASHRNVTGRGDAIDARFGLTQGVKEYQLGYAIPINAHDTTVSFRFNRTGALVVERPFDQIDIRSTAKTYQLGITQPVWRTLSESLSAGLKYEHRVSKTSLLGLPFSFTQGVPDGKSKVDVVRFSQDWVRRTPDKVIAVRSSFSGGRTNAEAQIDGIGPQERFFAWLGQFQMAKLFSSRHQLLLRTDIQYTRESLMPLEKIALGGMSTVRGYRENQFLRDSAVIASAEYRIPIEIAALDKTRLQLAAFVDYGNSWNADATPASPRSIASVGVGGIWEYSRHFQAQLYVAKPTKKVRQSSHDLQDSGIHFALTYFHF